MTKMHGDFRRARWTDEDNEALRRAVEKFAHVKRSGERWRAIGAEVGRSGAACTLQWQRMQNASNT